MNEKILKFECLQPRGCIYSNKLKMACARNWLKSYFELVGIKFVRCFIAVQNFKRFARV